MDKAGTDGTGSEAAWRIRRDARERARSMMVDPAEVELLRQRDLALYGHADGPKFEQLVEKLRRAGLDSDAIYEAIIMGAYRTDAEINRSFGI